LSKNLAKERIEIVVGGVHGDHGEIFSKKIIFSRRKNLYIADFTTGIQRIQVKSGEGSSEGGIHPPSPDCEKSCKARKQDCK